MRGDANRDGRVTVVDAVTQVMGIFGHVDGFPCEDAADSNDDGRVDIADALATLRFAFEAGPLPYPNLVSGEGPDPTCDPLRCLDSDGTDAIVINEIHYNPLDQRAEFVELANRSGVAIDVGGYAFTDGVRYVVPEGTMIAPGGFLVIARDPGWRLWRGSSPPPLGPWELELSDGGERLTLTGPCSTETLRYDDRAPWPIGPDGGRRSLERVDVRAPAADHRSWRTSFSEDGTPGVVNTTAGTPTRPTVAVVAIRPEHPTSRDPVEVTIGLDLPAESIARLNLRWERMSDELTEPASVDMVLDPGPATHGEAEVFYVATLPASPSPSMVRYTLVVDLVDEERPGGADVLLPHPAEPAPVFSYFVYDGDVEAKLPVLWAFSNRATGIVPGAPQISGVAIKEADQAVPAVYDGAEIRSSNQGFKIRFLKGAEYRGDRTLNVLPEKGGEAVIGGRGGPFAPYLEHFGFETYRDLGALAPEARWFRLLSFGGAAATHTQRVVFEQVNERFFARNGLDPDGDIYKLEHESFSKRTNPETGNVRLGELLRELRSNDENRVRTAVLELLDLDSFRRHSAISVLLSHGDNYTNNLFLYHDLSPEGRWKIVPWDLDTILQSPASLAAPSGGIVSGSYHRQPELDALYREFIAREIAPGGRFSLEAVEARTRSLESLLLEDLDLLEAQAGMPVTEQRVRIRDAYAEIRQKVRANIEGLRRQLN